MKWSPVWLWLLSNFCKSQRHFFFCEETGDGTLYYQSYTNRKWGKPEKLGYKAHRFSKFAAAYCNSGDTKILLFYYVTESNLLQELVGVPKTGGSFTWYSYNVPATKDLPANTFLALSQREKETLLVYRAPKTNDVSIHRTSSRAAVDDDEPCRAKWEKTQGSNILFLLMKVSMSRLTWNF